jgi:serine/threonine protein kinase
VSVRGERAAGRRKRPLGPAQPEQFGRYLLLDRIDVGGMAEVFRGRMGGVDGFERMVALKRILPNIAADPDFVEMFVDEAKLAVQFQHANIAQIYELGKVDGSHFIAMEYVSGVDLRTMWDRARSRSRLLPIAMSCHVMQKVCEGLDAAHRKKDERTGEDLGLVHRDVSPQNVLISFEGEVKVIDFGIAKASNKVSKTQAGVLKGKFGYMSPEQVRGLELDNRSDVFACGVVLYELLVGDRLFLGESDFSTLEKIRNVEMVPPTRLNKNLSPHLERIVMKALSKNREDRYRWASEMAEDLQRYLFATNQPFARTDLQRYMQQHFREEMAEEKARLAELRDLEPPEDEDEDQAPVEDRRAEPLTEVGAGALAAPLGGFGSVETDPSAPARGTADFDVSEPTANHTAVLAGGAPPAGRAGLPTWAAVLIGALVTVLGLGIVGVALWAKGVFGRPGGVSLTIRPEAAQVFLDDRLIANGSPVSLDGLEPGPHVLTVRAAGYRELVRPVSVVGGETQMLSLSLEPLASASVRVQTDPPGLLVELDGARAGTTPALLEGLRPGRHQVRLRDAEGALVDRFSVDLEPEATAERQIEVAELPARLEVRSTPAGAEARVGGLLRGRTPVTVEGLEPGAVEVELRKQGCAPHRERVTVRARRISALEADLRCP